MNKPDRLIKLLASASVLAVAAFAAIISYQHIFDLSRRHAATIGANGAYGITYGWSGVVISAWPAIAFIGSAELVLWLVRASAEHAAQLKVRRSAVRDTDKTVIRQWARDSGYEISNRGRIPAEIEAAYALRDSNGQYSMQANSLERTNASCAYRSE
jgi:hypothetical protein